MKNEGDSLSRVWIGLAHVIPRRGNDMLGTAAGAFVPVLAIARDEASFSEQAITTLHVYEFEVAEIEDIELFEARAAKHEMPPDLQALASTLSQERPVLLHTFHSYR
jgi:hypothetical protein